MLARGSEMSCLGMAPGGVQVIPAVPQGDIGGGLGVLAGGSHGDNGLGSCGDPGWHKMGLWVPPG